MADTKSTSNIKLAIIQGLIRLIASLPFKLARTIGAGVGYLTWLSNSRNVKVSQRNIELCYPDKDDTWKRQLLKKSCIESGKVFFESCWIWRRPNQQVQALIQNVEGLELIEQARESGKGVILTGSHLGNWEALLAWGGSNLPSSGMYRRPKIDALDPLIREARAKSGVELIIGERSSVRQMLTTLKNNRCFLMLSDQNPAKNSGVFAPFFHRDAYTMVIVQRLIEKTDAALLYFFAQRHANGFTIKIRPARFETRSLTPIQFATELNKGLVEQIDQCPEQYEWSYRRFRPQPEGVPPVYNDL